MDLNQGKIHLMIRNKDKIFFSEDVKAVTSYNDKGVFDVLPRHANFISMIIKGIIIHKFDRTRETFPIKIGGVMKVKDNTVSCYIDLSALDSTTIKDAIQPGATKS